LRKNGGLADFDEKKILYTYEKYVKIDKL